MKKIILIFLLLVGITAIGNAQVPTEHKGGVYIGQFASDPVNMERPNKVGFYWNTTTFKFRKWDGTTWSDLISGSLQDLQSVLDTGKYAENSDQTSYVDFDILPTLGAGAIDLFLTDNLTNGNFYLTNKLFALGAGEQLSTNVGAIAASKNEVVMSYGPYNNPTINSTSLIINRNSALRTHIFLNSPASTIDNTDYFVPLSVNNQFADSNGNITIAGGGENLQQTTDIGDITTNSITISNTIEGFNVVNPATSEKLLHLLNQLIQYNYLHRLL